MNSKFRFRATEKIDNVSEFAAALKNDLMQV